MKKMFALPCWLLINIMSPFLKEDHIWKDRFFSLSEWAKGRTFYTKSADFLLWGCMFAILFSIILSYYPSLDYYFN